MKIKPYIKSAKHSLERFLESLSPAQSIVYGFALLIVVSTLLLMLPAASRSGESIAWIDALFTSTSAACVTGLLVVDTHDTWTLFGQLVILITIQIGGLGIITMATWISIIARRKVTYKERLMIQESLNQDQVEGIVRLIKKVTYATVIIELLGASFLSLRFIPQFGIIKGIYMSIFHSVAAFCNAGFDLFGSSKSLIDYASDPLVILTISFLIIVGGLGFTVWRDISHYKKWNRLSLHSRFAITMTIILLIVGIVIFFALEYNNNSTMGNMNLQDKALNSFFQSVTTRTAGFATVPMGSLTEESKLMSMILMFIGASPGSTGGGIKTVTFGIIIFAILSVLKGNEETEIFKRTIPHRIVKKSLAIIFFSLFYVLIITLILAVIEDIPLLDLSFEVISAFGTVGLSTGITSSLSVLSKLLISLSMFLGRVGPLTLAFALTKRFEKKKYNYSYPEGKIMVG